MKLRRRLFWIVGSILAIAIACWFLQPGVRRSSTVPDLPRVANGGEAPARVSGEHPALGTIAGVVYGLDARPLAQVPVALRGPRLRRLVFTDSLGRYSSGGLAPGGYTLSSSVDGAGTSVACSVEATQTTRVDLQVVAVGPAVNLQGAIRDVLGGAVPAAEVWIDEEKPAQRIVTRAADDGRFVARVRQGEHTLLVRAAGYAPAFSLLTVTSNVAVDLVLHPAATIRGTVVDRGGLPVADARVYVDWFGADEVTSRSDGTFDIGSLSPGSYTVVAQHPTGWGRARGVRVGPSVSRGVRLEIEPTQSISGHVLGPTGAPVPGATVRVVGTETSTAPTATSGDDGSFKLSDVPQGRMSVEACAVDFICNLSPEHVVTGVDLTGINVLLTKGASIHVSVVDSAGAPVAGADASIALQSCTTRDDGTCVLTNLRPQATRLRAQHPLSGRGEMDIVVRVGTQQASVRLDTGATVRGVATWDDGGPAAGVQVVAGNVVGRTDGEGRYELANVGPGSVTIYATETLNPESLDEGEPPIGSRPLSLEVRPREHRAGVDLVVARRTWRITGRGLDHAGAPVAYARLAASPSSRRDGDGPRVIGESAVWYAAADGTFALDRLPNGVFDIWAEADEEPRGVTRNVRAGSMGIEVRLPEPSTLMGDVIASTGARVTDALVVIKTARCFREQRARDGRFEFNGLGATKRIEVNVTTPTGLLGGVEAIELRVGERKTVQIVAHEALSIRGRLVEWPDSKPVSAVTLLASCGVSRWSTPTEEDGSFRVNGLIPGVVLFWSFDPDHGLRHERWQLRLTGEGPTTDIGTLAFIRRGDVSEEASPTFVHDGDRVVVANASVKSTQLFGLRSGDTILSIAGHAASSFSIPGLGAVLEKLGPTDELTVRSAQGDMRNVRRP